MHFNLINNSNHLESCLLLLIVISKDKVLLRAGFGLASSIPSFCSFSSCCEDEFSSTLFSSTGSSSSFSSVKSC